MRQIVHGGASRPSGGSLTRFKGHSSHGHRDRAALSDTHPAVVEGRTLFPKSVVDADKSPRLLVSGMNSAKIGSKIVKGPWVGMKVFTLTLEERATCPSSCHLWNECYGNAMPFARRHKFDEAFISVLENELLTKAEVLGRFAVRLHVLGDFPNIAYVAAWRDWLRRLPGLHVWGYTAHAPFSGTGTGVRELNEDYPDRCAIRFSGPTATPGDYMRATTIWKQLEGAWVKEGLVCPVSTNKAQACGSCGLCWSPEMRDTPIVFIGHGMNTRSGK